MTEAVAIQAGDLVVLRLEGSPLPWLGRVRAPRLDGGLVAATVQLVDGREVTVPLARLQRHYSDKELRARPRAAADPSAATRWAASIIASGRSAEAPARRHQREPILNED